MHVGARSLVAGVAVLAVASVAGATLYLHLDADVPAAVQPDANILEDIETWKVVGATSAHQVLVVDVETIDPDAAPAIAADVVEPVRDRDYEEILIYFYPAGRTSTEGALRRIQWTPAGGFVEIRYDGGP